MDLPLAMAQSLWLVQQGYSPDLQKRYRNSEWFTSIGTGTIIRSGDKVDYEGAIYHDTKNTNSLRN